MKFFLTILLLSALMLSLGSHLCAKGKGQSPASPLLLGKEGLLESFEAPRNAHAFWAFLTGEKNLVSPKLKKQFDQLELGFLFSPSGIHLSGFLMLWMFILKKILQKKTYYWVTKTIIVLCLLLPSLAIKRIVFFKILLMLKGRLKKRWSIESLFFATFGLSYLCGHFKTSPLGFIMSFLFLGTILSLRDQRRPILIFGLFLAHLTLCYFQGGEVSLFALFLDIPLLLYFSSMMSLSGIYLISYKILKWNWIEKIVALFLWLIKKGAKLTTGTHIHASSVLILGLVYFMVKKDKRALAAALLFHANLAYTPSLIVSGSWSPMHGQSAHKSLYQKNLSSVIGGEIK